ncbi:hypothetical protein C0993_002681, partial [Termitomyces sp. T159_Od127]
PDLQFLTPQPVRSAPQKTLSVKVGIEAMPVAQSLSVSAVSMAPTPTGPTSSMVANSVIQHSNIQSRSGRTIIPSSWAQKLNEIGTDMRLTKVPEGQENILPSDTLVRPNWVEAAHSHFITRKLGNEWTACIESVGAF